MPPLSLQINAIPSRLITVASSSNSDNLQILHLRIFSQITMSSHTHQIRLTMGTRNGNHSGNIANGDSRERYRIETSVMDNLHNQNNGREPRPRRNRFISFARGIAMRMSYCCCQTETCGSNSETNRLIEEPPFPAPPSVLP